MSIEKLRHGSEITSAKLNEIIDVINNTNNEHQTIRDLGESIKGTVKEVYNTLEKYSEQVGEHLEFIPEIKNLYADILLARDSVDWIDISEDDTDATAKIASALNGYDGDSEEPAQRLKIIRGNFNQVNMNTPEKIDKQILIAYQTDSDGTLIKGMLYFDYYDSATGTVKRCPVTATGDVNIASVAPTLEFETLSNGEEVIKMTHPDGTVTRSSDLRGPAGLTGAVGPEGPRGPQGEKGEQGIQGIQGTKGQDGATTRLSIWFSEYPTGINPTENYNNQKYMGIKTYLSTDDEATMWARPIKWFRISGDTLYPVYDEKTGYLTFTTERPKEAMSYKIVGPKGDTGPEGKVPEIVFAKEDGTTISLTSESVEGKWVYDASAFSGAKGPTGPIGPVGPKGEKGDKPLLHFSATSTEDSIPSIEETTVLGSQYDAEYTIKIPKGKDGLSLLDAKLLADGTLELQFSRNISADHPTIDKFINIGSIKGDKGDPATIAIKGAVDNFTDLPVNDITSGDAYVVTSTVDGQSISELYICVDPLAEDLNKIYKNLGNIKGDKGDTGSSGSIWIVGTTVTQSGQFTLTPGYNKGDLYLNTSTGRIYEIHEVNDSSGSYTFIEKTTDTSTLKGPQGDPGEAGKQGEAGIGISKIEKTQSLENIDTYTITLTNNSTFPFNVTNGLNGKDGNDGNDGTKIHTDISEPEEALGVVGDYYLNKTNGYLYKKTGDNTWTYQNT